MVAVNPDTLLAEEGETALWSYIGTYLGVNMMFMGIMYYSYMYRFIMKILKQPPVGVGEWFLYYGSGYFGLLVEMWLSLEYWLLFIVVCVLMDAAVVENYWGWMAAIHILDYIPPLCQAAFFIVFETI